MGDEIAHGFGLAAMIAGAVVGAVAGAAIVAATAATGGLAAVIIAGSVAAGGLSMGQIVSGLSTIFNLPEPTSGVIAVGSPNVFTNKRPAARALLSMAGGCSGSPFNHPPLPMAIPVQQGSLTVMINKQPASRLKDKLMCGAHIKSGSSNVLIGGETTTVGFIFDLEAWTKKGLEVLGLAALIGGGLFAAAAGVAALGTYVAIAGGIHYAMKGLGAIGDALGPGYSDLLQGIAGMGLVIGGPKLARGAADEAAAARAADEAAARAADEAAARAAADEAAARVAADRAKITDLSNNGDIAGARDILRPHLERGDVDAVVNRLDVSSPRDGGFLWSGNGPEAAAQAKAAGGITLEGTPGGRVIDGWDEINTNLPWDKGGEQLWGGASRNYAQGLSGKVRAVQTQEAYDNGGGFIYKNYELEQVNEGLKSGRITSFDVTPSLPPKLKAP